MQCIQHQFFHILPVFKNSRADTKLHWQPTTVPTKFLNNQNICSSFSQRTQALSSNSSLVLGLTSTTSPSPNIYIFIGTSAVLFFMFWIANFVVPEMVIKNLETEESNGEQRVLDVGKKAGDVEKGKFGQNEKP
ncbi:hypothetical protein ACHQM5_004292 [Ranunculus cassubicifolius]